MPSLHAMLSSVTAPGLRQWQSFPSINPLYQMPGILMRIVNAQKLYVLAGGYQGPAVFPWPKASGAHPFLTQRPHMLRRPSKAELLSHIPILIIHCTQPLSSQTRVTYWSPSHLRFAWQELSDDGKMTVKVSWGILKCLKIKKNFFNALFSLNYIWKNCFPSNFPIDCLQIN